jgi:hypothetical protein
LAPLVELCGGGPLLADARSHERLLGLDQVQADEVAHRKARRAVCRDGGDLAAVLLHVVLHQPADLLFLIESW